MQNKRGYFFSVDAFIALLIILSVVLFIKPTIIQVSNEENLHQDLLVALSAIKIGDFNNSYAQNLIANGNITNLDNSVLEQIGEFYALSDPEAQNLADEIFDELNLSQNVGLYFGNDIIARSGSLDISDAESISAARQIISGIRQGPSVTGYSARAFLFSERKVDYFYFGGYVGDGNLTAYLGENVIGANIEGAFSGSFDLYINNQYASSHNPTPNIPYKISLANNFSMFVPGGNYLEFRSSAENLYIAGGYVRVVYSSYDLVEQAKTKYFPGVRGLINLYDSFYVPAALRTMEVRLHYNSSYNIFLNIGSKEMYQGNSSGQEVDIILNNTYLCDKWQPGVSCDPLPYFGLNERTVPLRLGLRNVSYAQNVTIPVDIYSLSQFSKSMKCTISGGNCDVSQSKCEDPLPAGCGGEWLVPVNYAREANYLLINRILSMQGARVGIIGYTTAIASQYPPGESHVLTNNAFILNNTISQWEETDFTSQNSRLCLAIQQSVADFQANPSNVSKVAIVMSAGAITHGCGIDTLGIDWNNNGINNGVNGVDYGDEAVKAACDAHDLYNITFYSVGYGNDTDTQTLTYLAQCGGGNYYYSAIDDLVEIYARIIEDVIKGFFHEQTIIFDNSQANTRLYPDSYIRLGYDAVVPYGMIIYTETDTFDVTGGNFSFPSDSFPFNARVVSYSGPKWTSKADISYNGSGNWITFFNLSNYSSNFTDLGDPYMVEIPRSRIKPWNSTVRVFLGTEPSDLNPGSNYNKIIYSIRKNFSSYSPISASADGCIWDITFEDGSSENISVPANYTGNDMCSYNPTLPPPDYALYNDDDAIESAVFNLLADLDLNSNGKIEVKFTENELSLDTTQIEGIPFTWDTEVQARTWR